ncbi:hypothetical protein GpartN1_g4638.t1 [Galdieria partita]|uniref:Protein prenyltransferase alpha subunit repeat-containing protein 1 n=1 Tax=Galdieria partita TaxID=83374 RepID=A0A9C7URX2_9RHOD|nr:hypothetical protein GpartN1_g4638.t1 [Galdieria partita]
MADSTCELPPPPPPEISKQLSIVLRAVELYEYSELEVIPVTWSDTAEDTLDCEMKEDILVIQGSQLLVVYVEALQLFNRFCQHLKRGSLSEHWRLWDCLSRFLLFVQPDQSTIWNFRKFLLLQNLVSYDLELQVNRIALKRNAKTSEVWQHRKWILAQAAHIVIHSDFIERELELCSFLVNRFEKPYHVWYYRWWLVHSYIGVLSKDFVMQEYHTIKLSIQQHVSDHGAYFYRQKLLLYLLNNQNTPDDCFVLLNSEWNWTHSIIKMLDRSFVSPFSYTQFIYSCCYCWLDNGNSQQRYLMDTIYKILKYYTIGNQQDDKILSTMLSKMSQQLCQNGKKIFHKDERATTK